MVILSQRCILSAWWRHQMETLQWRHNGHDGASNHQPHHCLLNRLFRRRSKKTSKLCVTGLCAGNSPVTGEFHGQMASNAENVSIWWHHHDIFRVTGPLCGEFTGHRWIPLTKASHAELDIFFALRLNIRLSKHSRGWWFETPSRPLWCRCKEEIV